ncbi:ABC transporter permease [Lacibacterium aquatile]|uniref:ABC transporter permease n=1 Tax=Lacibacterium aquatile TaxID=1168082 RepID=A0ABW5DPL4_9PROT
MSRFWRNPTLMIGLVLTLLMVGIALVSLVWTPEVPTRLRLPFRLRAPFGESGLLGTDHMGRDVVSMLMAGSWNSLAVAIPSVLLGLAGGVSLGLIAAARGGWLDEAIMRAADITFAFPAVLTAIMLGVLIGGGAHTAILAIGIFNIPVFARVSRAAALQVLAREFIAAARGAGKGPILIAVQHVLPNIAGILIVQATIQLALAVLTEAGLSYLGVGIAPPAPSWGRMLAESQTFMSRAPWLALLPGLCIAIAVLGLNLLGDGLRDALDPKLKARR